MEAIFLALASIGAAGSIAFLGRRLYLAQARLDVVRRQRSGDRAR